MDADQRVRLAHHLISTSIVKKLVCPSFSGSLQVYPTEHLPSTFLRKIFSGDSSAAAAFQQLSRAANTNISCYPFRGSTSTPHTTQISIVFRAIFGTVFTGWTTYYNHSEKRFHDIENFFAS